LHVYTRDETRPRFPSTVMSVASSRDGRFVYVTFDGTDPRTKPPMIAIVVEELDASSLKVLARQYIDAELAALATAVPGGDQHEEGVLGDLTVAESRSAR